MVFEKAGAVFDRIVNSCFNVFESFLRLPEKVFLANWMIFSLL